jgi:thiol-disulfide isomerase/thioredoxin
MFSSHKLSANRVSRVLSLLILLVCCFLPTWAQSQSALDLNGKSVDPIKSSQGRITVLIFVRTDCPISNRYAPLLQRLSDSLSAKAKFWLVYPDKKTTGKEIAAHLKQFPSSISALRDPHHSLVKLASATITPEAAVFDAQGRLLYHGRIDNWYEDAGRSRPAATTHELQNAVEAALGGKPAPLATAPAIGCYISDLE